MAFAPTVVPRPGRPVLTAAFGCVIAYTLVVGVIGYRVIDRSWAPTAMESAYTRGELGLLPILFTNLGAVLLLWSGAGTGGLTTLAGLTWTGAYVGATLSIAVANVGARRLLSQVWLYLPIELGAMVVASVGGVLPVLASLHRGSTGQSASRRYLTACRTSLRLLLASTGFLVVAAVAEVLTGA